MSLFTKAFYKMFRTTPIKILNRCAQQKVNLTLVSSSFTPIYRFPYISLCSALNKLKKIQLGMFVVAVPSTYICCLVNVCGPQIPMAVSTIGIASTIALFSVGQLFNRFIGYVYVSRNENQIKLAYLDFWGKRLDIICDIKDIVPLNDSSSSSLKNYLYRTVWISSNDRPFKINLSNGQILNEDIFKLSFFKTSETGYDR